MKAASHSRFSSRVRKQHGMAMLEVLVSVLLFSLGVLGLFGLQAHAIKFSVEADTRNRAALLANEVATAMWLANSVAIDTATEGNAWDARAKAELPSGDIEVAAVDAAVMPNSADVTVTWKPPQRSASEPDSSRLRTRVTLPPP